MLYTKELVITQERVRCFRVEIENPNVGSKKISYHQELLLEDENGNEVSKKMHTSLHVSFDDVATKTLEIADPVTGETVTVSGAAVAMWIEEHYIQEAQKALTVTE